MEKKANISIDDITGGKLQYDAQENDCCNGEKVGQDLQPVMKVMRIANRRGKPNLNLTDLLEDLMNSTDYNSIFHGNGESESKFDPNSMIPWCEKKELDDMDKHNVPEQLQTLNCDLFDPVVTDVGICHSFNAKPTADMLQDSYFKKNFETVYKTDLSKESIINGTGSGQEHALNFYLMDSDFRRLSKKTKPSSFRLGLSTQTEYFDMKYISKWIKPGFHTIWKVQAMEIFPSGNLRSVPIDKRNCKFPDETEGLDIFKIYSRKACQFECRLKKAAEVCQCHPWNIPNKVQKNKHTLCDVYGNFCFNTIMNRKSTWKNCTCLPTCHHIEFTYNEQLNSIDVSVCENKYSVESKIAGIMVENGYNSLAYKYFKMKEYEKFGSNDTLEKWDIDSFKTELCKEMLLKYMAKVSVMFDKETYVRTKTSLKVTFTDKLAAFGKISNF